MTIRVLVLLLNRTETPTTGGLENIFDEGKKIDATTIFLILSFLGFLVPGDKFITYI